MTPREHRILRAVAALALIGAVVAVILAVTHPTGQSKNAVRSGVKQTAVNAIVSSQSVPNPSCFPPLGAGHLGSCAPVQAMGAANALGVAAGDPDHIRGTLGVDVSSYQGCSINWSRVNVAFAFFKATEYTGYTDACARHNVASAKAAHKAYGLYDFLRPAPNHSATAEADHFVAVVNSVGGNTSLPPVADVEANAGLSPAGVHSYVCTWEARVRTRLHRSTVITYTGNWFWGTSVHGDSCGGSKLWDSAYAPYAIVPLSWRGHGGMTIWQYSDGIFGPTPHLLGWDSDVLTQGTLAGLGAQAKIAKPVSLAKLKQRRATLRRVLRSHGCRARVRHRQHVGPRCHRWFMEGQAVNRQIRARGGR